MGPLAWEDPIGADHGGGGGVESDSDAEPHLQEATPAEELVSYLMGLHLLRRLNAKELSIICHWAGMCGIKEAAKVGKPPGASSGHYARRVREAMGSQGGSDHGYAFSVPAGQATAALGRTSKALYAHAAHEAISASIEPTDRCRLDEAIEGDELPPCYHNSPAVKEYGTKVFPTAIYLDGVNFTRRESVLAFYIYILFV